MSGHYEKRKLRCSGALNAVGQALMLRNNEWLDGPMPGLCIALGGNSTDVSPNDRLPILPETHETDICKKRCVRPKRVKRMTRLVQRIQSNINGYFGGYITKRQRAGKMETKKCIDKMYTLRERDEGKTLREQQRAVSGRMITDIEMNGTVRGAVELYNLAKNLRRNDALFAECVRTFATRDVDARAWLHRLEMEVQKVETIPYVTQVPTTIRPHVRNDRGKPSYPDS